MRDFLTSGQPVRVIWRRWTPIKADVVRGRTVTSYPGVATDLRHSGANWIDQEVVVDGNPDRQPQPDDLPAFCTKLVAPLKAARS